MPSLSYRPEMLADVPEERISFLKQYEDWFTVETPKLKKITDHFVKELDKGLSKEGGNIPMNVTWITAFPNGSEEGRVLTIDMGGTNLRVCDVYLPAGRRDFEQTHQKYKLPEEIKTGTGEQLWGWIADCLKSFMEDKRIEAPEGEKFSLAFTFSFPVYQCQIKHGVLQRWTKNFNVTGVEGHDVVPQLEAAIERKQLPVQIVALINDTTGTLLASHYCDPHVKVGSIFSTGCNAAYMEYCKNIPKLQGNELAEDATVIINTEYGAFDNDRKVLPRTPFDVQIDQRSVRPGTQIYEKMVAGLYIGEMLRLVLVTLWEEGKLFQGQDISRLRREHAVDTTFLSIAELDITEGLREMRAEFEENFSLSPSMDDLKICRYLIGLIGKRAARLYACGIAAICKKTNTLRCHVGVDGAVFNKYSGFKSRASQALREIFDWPAEELDLIALNPSQDGSGVGAALAAALTTGCESRGRSAKTAFLV
ncbi:Hexokinase [Penicillium brasilianum]|uniref:Phosphotransferase n=1 Tax=Penicillium brasilianum TaxID=104259 RepID=A0A1S9RZ91_PENBI|nr:Hexokinase [Penicillium brasilianum]